MSLKPLLKGRNELERKELIWHYPHYHGSSWTPGSAARKGKWKLIKFYHWEKSELDDPEKDPSESANVFSQHPDVAVELDSLLMHSIKDMGGAFPVKNQ